jgi:transposase
MNQPYRIAGIDIHKKMLAVVVTEIGAGGEFTFERRKFGTLDSDLKELSQWLAEREVKVVVMESTAQYWRPVWFQLEGQCALHLAQAQSNRAPRGRKRDFGDAERLVRRYVAGELILSFVPGPEQRLWRTLTRTKYQLTRDRVSLQNQLEAFLEEARLKLGACVSDLLGTSSQRMLRAIAKGETDTAVLAGLKEENLRATPERLADALRTVTELSPVHREILQLFLDRVDLIDRQLATLTRQIASSMKAHQDAVIRLSKVPGFGVDSAQQVIAEIGPAAATFASPGELASWVGVCPGREESAEKSKSNRSPKGNRAMRRVLNQAANSAVKTQGSIFEARYRRLLPRLGHNKAIWAIAHQICRITWIILHRGVEYIEYGKERNAKAEKKRLGKLLRQLRGLGYQIIAPPTHEACA